MKSRVIGYFKYIFSLLISFIICLSVYIIFNSSFKFLIFLFLFLYFLVLSVFNKQKKLLYREYFIAFFLSLILALTFAPVYSVPKGSINIKYIPKEDNKLVKVTNIRSGIFPVDLSKYTGGGALALYGDKEKSVDIEVVSRQPIIITYHKSSIGGKAEVQINNRVYKEDLNAKVNETASIEYKGLVTSYSVFKQVLRILIVFLSLFVVSIILFGLIKYNRNYLYGASLLYLFYVFSFVGSSNFTLLLLVMLTLFISFLITKFYSSDYLEKWKSKLNIILYILIGVFITFMAIGYDTFLLSETPIFINFTLVLYFVLILILVLYYIFGILILFEKLELFWNKKSLNKNNKRVFFVSFILLSIGWLVWAFIFYPGNLSPDSIDVWSQASGVTKLNNAHPILFTIILRLFASIFDNPFSFVIFQILLLAFIVSLIIKELYKNGISFKFLIIVLVILVLGPNISILNTIIWKDILFTITLLFITYLIYKLVRNENSYDRKIGNIIVIIISLVLLMQLRYNGVVSVLILFIYFLILFFKRKNKMYLILIIGTLLCNFTVNNLVYRVFDIEDRGVGGIKYASIVKNFAATLYYDKPLDKKANDLIKDILPNDKFIAYYSGNSIDCLFYSEKGLVEKWYKVLGGYSFTEIVPLYIKNIIKNPDVFIRDKFDGMYIMFNLSTKNYASIYSYDIGISQSKQGSIDLLEKQTGVKFDGDRYMPNNKSAVYLTKHLHNGRVSKIQVFLWRGSLFLSILLILILYLIISRKMERIGFLLPVIGYTLSWCIALNHQSFRYIYYLNLITIFLVLLCLSYGNNRNKKNMNC